MLPILESLFVNLKIPDKTHDVAIANELFLFEGEHSLMTLENGGGKTSLVLLMLQVFWPGKRRGERRLSDYLSDNGPSCIVMKLKKDKRAYSVGLVAQKRRVAEDMTGVSDAEMFMFIAEHQSLEDLDLPQLSPKGFYAFEDLAKTRLKTYGELQKQIREEAKKNACVEYFHGSNAKAYKNALNQHFPHLEAWVEKVWEINEQEGGATVPFTEGKDKLIRSHKVIEQHLIPMIQKKVAVPQVQIEQQFEHLAEEYAKLHQTQSLREALERFDTVIQTSLLPLQATAQAQTQQLNQTKQALAALLEQLTPYLNAETEQVNHLEEAVQTATREIHYHKVAQTVKRAEEAQAKVTEATELLEKRKEAEAKAQADVTETLNQLEAQEGARRAKALHKATETLHQAQLQEKTHLQTHEEQATHLKEVQHALAQLTATEWDEIQAETKALRHAIQALESTLKAKETMLTETLSVKQGTLMAQHAQLTHEISDLRTALGEVDVDTLAERVEEAAQTLNEQATLVANLTETQSTLTQGLTETTSACLIAEGALKLQAYQRDEAEAAFHALKNKEVEALELLANLSQEPFDALRKESVRKQAIHRVHEDFNDSAEQLNAQIYHHQAILKRAALDLGDIELSDELMRELSEYEVPYQTGLAFLKSCEASKQTGLLAEHPYLPYVCLVDSPQALMQVKRIQADLTEPVNVLFMLNPTLNWGLTLEANGFLLVSYFDGETLNPAYRETVRTEATLALKEAKENLKQLNQRERNWQRALEALTDTAMGALAVAEKTYRAQNLAVMKEEEHVQQLKLQQQSLSIQVEKNQLALAEAKESLDDTRQLKTQLTHWLQQANELVLREQALITLTDGLAELNTEIEQVKAHILTLKNEQSALLERDFTQRARERQVKQKKTQYQAYHREEPAKEDLLRLGVLGLEEHVRQLESVLDLTHIKKAIQDAQEAVTHCEEDLGLLDLDPSVYEKTQYEKATVTALKANEKTQRDTLKQATKAREKQAEVKAKLDGTFEAASKQQETAVKGFVDAYGTTPEFENLPTVTELIQTVKDWQEQLETTNEALIEANGSVAKLNGMKERYAKSQDEFLITAIQKDAPLESPQPLSMYFESLENAEQAALESAKQFDQSFGEWNQDYQSAWTWSTEDEALFSPYAALTKTKQNYPTLTLENYLVALDGMPRLATFVTNLLRNCNEKLSDLDEQKDCFLMEVEHWAEVVYQELVQFDHNMTIPFESGMRRVLKLSLKYQEGYQKETAIASLKEVVRAHVEQLFLEASNDLATDEESGLSPYYKLQLTPASLIGRLVQYTSSKLQVLKVTNTSANLENWESDASGGQGALKAIILIFAMFKYVNPDVNGSSIIMDNPFGKMSSHKLVSTMFEVAQKLRIQLICLTGIVQSDLQSQFTVHYKLRHTVINPNRVQLYSRRLEQGSYHAHHRPPHESLITDKA